MLCNITKEQLLSDFLQDEAQNFENCCFDFSKPIDLSDPENILKFRNLYAKGIITDAVIDRIEQHIQGITSVPDMISKDMRTYSVKIPNGTQDPLQWLTGYANKSIRVLLQGNDATVIAESGSFNCPTAVEI